MARIEKILKRKREVIKTTLFGHTIQMEKDVFDDISLVFDVFTFDVLKDEAEFKKLFSLFNVLANEIKEKNIQKNPSEKSENNK
ncbi:hypothetical protein CQA57_07065 [Helicobacter anseris]|uniref:Uncharacterized protein n=1 Tax=Helicobacter anseris TaxID=375926 RepID=A0A3D8J594_9HELI|nr:hypothetical protein [Helicobacter anseris]RDU72356.1 hypothetical protein CQA57_07065 [Helicobacter anseris]